MSHEPWEEDRDDDARIASSYLRWHFGVIPTWDVLLYSSISIYRLWRGPERRV